MATLLLVENCTIGAKKKLIYLLHVVYFEIIFDMHAEIHLICRK
jgi:hypothetical protein